MDKAHPPLKKDENISDLKGKPEADSEIFCGTNPGDFQITEKGKISVRRLKNCFARAYFDQNPKKVRADVVRYVKGHLKTMGGKKVNK